jgi:hypothetical protein
VRIRIIRASRCMVLPISRLTGCDRRPLVSSQGRKQIVDAPDDLVPCRVVVVDAKRHADQ